MNQSNPILAKRIAELERQLTETNAYFKAAQSKIETLTNLYRECQLSEATAKQYAEEVDKQNQELAAQVQALREAWEAVKRNDWDAPLDEAFEKTPQHHLRQVRADAGRDGFIACAEIFLDLNEDQNIYVQYQADQYCDQVRRGKEPKQASESAANLLSHIQSVAGRDAIKALIAEESTKLVVARSGCRGTDTGELTDVSAITVEDAERFANQYADSILAGRGGDYDE